MGCASSSSSSPSPKQRVPASPLHEAARRGDCTAIRSLLLENANPRQQNSDGDTPLHLAIREGNDEAARVMLQVLRGEKQWPPADLKALVDTQNHTGISILHDASIGRRQQIVDVITNCGADVNKATSDGNTPLHCAALAGSKETVEILLRHGASRTAINYAGTTPVDLAKLLHHSEVIQLLS